MPNVPKASDIAGFKPGAGSGDRKVGRGLANTETQERACVKSAMPAMDGSYVPKSPKINGGTLGSMFGQNGN